MAYTAHQGNIIYLDFEPQAVHEQKGRRPAMVVSNDTFNNLIKSAALVCPIINTDRGFPLHVSLHGRIKTTGVIMCEQVKSLDIYARNAEFKEKAPQDIVDEVVDILTGFIEIL